MTRVRPNRKKRNRGGGNYAALAILAIIVLTVVGFLLLSPRVRAPERPRPAPDTTVKPARPAKSRPQPQRAAEPHQTAPAGEQPVPAEVPRVPVAQAQRPVRKPDSPVEKPEPAVRTPEPVAPGAGRGRLAIIIDDMGSSLQEARALAGIGVPLTFSIIPGLRSYRDVASYAAANGVETMIHIPMQSKGWPQRRLEPNGLLVSMDGAVIRERLEEFMREIPRAVGANNHMGSEFTEHEEQMTSVLEALKQKRLFFVDSVTTPGSVGLRLSHAMGVRSAKRNVFLDNEQNCAYIMGQLSQAARQAKKNGSAIAICHPHPATIRALSAALPSLKSQGITLVHASQLVR